MRTETRNRLVMLRAEVVAELPRRLPGHRRFVSVVPVEARHRRDPSPPLPGQFRIHEFELLDTLINDDYSPYSGDLRNEIVRWAQDIDGVEACLDHLGIDSSQLGVPWRTDYPL